MKTWKKIITLAILMFVSVGSFFACGKSDDKYEKMSIELISQKDFNNDDIVDNTISFSNDATKNTFTLVLDIADLPNDTSDEIICSIDDTSKVSLAKDPSYNGRTTFVFKIESGGETFIRFKTVEGDKTYVYPIKIVIPITDFSINNNLIPLIRGGAADLTEGLNYLTYYPSNTSQRGVKYEAYPIEENPDQSIIDEIAAINKYINDNNHASIKVPFSVNGVDTTITSFLLRITAKDNETITKTAIVNVLDKIDARGFSLIENIDESAEEVYPLLSYDEDNDKYTLTLASNQKDHFNYRQATLQVMHVLDEYSDSSQPLHEYRKDFQRFDPKDISKILPVNVPAYSVKIKYLKDDGSFENTKLISARDIGDSKFQFTQEKMEDTYTTYFCVDYYGFEGMFDHVEIPLDIQVKTFPSEIRLFESKKDMEIARSTNGLGVGDNEIVIYSNGVPTLVYTDVWGDATSISDTGAGHALNIVISNPNIEILDINNNPITSCLAGTPIYLKKIVGSEDITDEVTLTITSSVYSKVTKTIKLQIVNQATTITVSNAVIPLSSSDYGEESKTVMLITEGYWSFSGLPVGEDGLTDYSTLTVEVGDKSIVEYTLISGEPAFIVYNKIGTTTVTITTENNVPYSYTLTVHYPITNVEFFKIQIEDFEEYSDDIAESEYVYRFAGSEDRTNTYHTKLLVGNSYNYYYFLGNNNNINEMRRYDNLNGIMTINAIESEDTSKVSIKGNLITLSENFTGTCKLSFTYTTLVEEMKIYFNIVVHAEIAVSKIQAKFANPVDIYDLKTIDSSAVNKESGKLYTDEFGKELIILDVNPSNATTKYSIKWLVAVYNPVTKVSSYFTEDNNQNDGKQVYTSENPDYYGLTITLVVNEYKGVTNGESVTLTVSNLPSASFGFYLYPVVLQSYINQFGEVVENSENNFDRSYIHSEIYVEAYKNLRVGDIKIFNAYNNTVNFDIRDEVNTVDLEYALVERDNNGKKLLVDEITISNHGDPDLEVLELGNNIIRVTLKDITGEYVDNPVYKIELISNDNSSGLIKTVITIKVATGSVENPFQIGSVQDLEDIRNTSKFPDALNSHYVLVKNINLKDISKWTPIGTSKDPFNGSLSGRYYLNEAKTEYRDYAIMNLNIIVDNSGIRQPAGNDENNYGLFGCIGSTGSVKYLSVYSYAIDIKSYDRNDNSVLTENIGVIAAKNFGKIINCTVDDGLITKFNGATINTHKTTTKGINYDAGNSSVALSAHIGLIAGYNASEITSSKVRGVINITNYDRNTAKYVRAGGVVGINLNTGVISGRETDFLVSNGLDEFDVAVMINPHQANPAKDYRLSCYGSFGGAAGINVGTINGLFVRSFVYNLYSDKASSSYGIGGLIGDNRGTVTNNVVLPTVIGQNNVGGLIGCATNEKLTLSEEENLEGILQITSNKVQFIDFDDDYVYLNTSIYGSENVGGLIGYYYNSDVTVTHNGDKISSIAFENAIYGNSVSTYFKRSMAYSTYESDQINSTIEDYYGDIVIKENANENYVSGFIGRAYNALIINGYVNVNISFKSNEKTYVGGILGKGSGIVSIFNTQVLGKVINNSPSISAEGYVGNFIGDATNINTYYDNKELKFVISPKTASSDADKVNENVFDIIEYASTTSDAATYKNSLNDLLYLGTTLNIYDINLSCNLLGMNYEYGNIVSSYSLLQLRDFTSTIYNTIDNFVASGETRKYTNGNGNYQMGVKFNTRTYNVDYVNIPNILVYNSFYTNYVADLKLNVDNLTTLESSQVDLDITKTITLDDISKVYFEKVVGTYTYYLSAYNYDYVYKDADDNTIRTYVYYNNPLVVSSDKFNETSIELNNTYGSNGVTKTIEGGEGETFQKLYNIFYSADNSATGLNRQEVYGVEGIGENDINKYYRFFNSQIHSAYPIALAGSPTYTIDNTQYINLIINIPPTIINLDVKNDSIEDDRVWVSTIEGLNSITIKNKTITYFELYYADEKSEASKYASMPWKVIDGEKVIDLDLDGNFEDIEKLYCEYINSYISNKNIYSLDEIIGIEIMPQFLRNGMISFNYVNPNDEDIAKISIIDNRIVLEVFGTGSVTFTVSSAYNPDKTNMSEFTINIISPENQFGIYSDSVGLERVTDISLPLYEKSSPMYAILSGELTDYDNEFLKTYCHKDLKLMLKSFDNYGVRYFYYKGEGKDKQLYFDDPTEVPNILIGQNRFKELVIDGKYYYYVDMPNAEFSITGEDTENNIKIFAMPYFTHGVDRTYLGSMDNINAGYGTSFEVSVVRGVSGVYVDVSEDIEITPPKTIAFEVLIETDDEDSALMIEAQDSRGNYLLINSLDTKVVLDSLTTYYLGNIALTLDSVSFDEKANIKQYNFVIGVAEQFWFENFIGDYKLIFSAAKNIYTPNVIFDDEVNVSVYATPIQDVFLEHYTTVDQYTENVDIYDFNDYFSSNTLVSGYPGLLRINLYPSHANIDYVEVMSNGINGKYIAMEQLLAVYDNSNSYFNGYYIAYNDERTLLETSTSRGIRLGKVSKLYNSVEHEYNGILYVRTFAPEVDYGNNEFTLTVTCYLKDGSSYQLVYPNTSKDKNTINIYVTKTPTIDLSIDSSVVAFGDTLEITADVDEELEIEWLVTGKSGLTTSITPVLNTATGKYELGINGIQTLIDTFGDYKQLIGEEITIKATVSYTTKGRVYSSSDIVKVKLALLTIDEISVKYVENGNFVGVYNQTYELKVIINKYSYDSNHFVGDDNLIFTLVEQFENKLSNYMSNTFFYKNGNNWTPFTVGQTNDFMIDLFGDYFTITNNMRYPTTTIWAKAVFEYGNYASSTNTYGITINPKSYLSDYAIERDCIFGLDFIRLSNEENPEPIYTQTELMNMEAGGYYILLSDITLNNWTPISTEIASLDGNGYVITIENKVIEEDGVRKEKNSFYNTTLEIGTGAEEDTETQNLDLGIFSTISSQTTIKNLIIEVVGTVDIDVAHYGQVQYGTLAAINEGIVTNVVMTNNANKYRNERNSLLFNKGLIDSYLKLDEGSNTVEELSTINLNYGSFTAESTSNRIGVFVGVNNGYITNSNVNNINISGLDCVAGFVAENQKTISSSYYAGGNISAQVSAINSESLGAAGFVFFNSGTIAYSYSAGNRFTDDKGNEISSTGLNLNSFNGRNYGNLPLRLRSTGVIVEGGNCSGFVYENASGKIIDSYSNILVSGRKTAGFVYTNSGIINNVYTLSSVLYSDANSNPFIGINETKTDSNNTGTINNAYYLHLLNSDIPGGQDGYQNASLQDAVAVSKEKLSSYTTFETFAFNSNYDSSSDIIYEDDKITAIEEIVRSVWFYPSGVTTNSGYFRNSTYTAGVPQLVSANLNNYSLKYYVSGNSTRIVDTLYEEIMGKYSLTSDNFSKNSIVNTFEEVYIDGLVNKIPGETSQQNVINTIKAYANLLTNTTIKNKYANADIVSSTLIQYINVDLYLTSNDYLVFDSNSTTLSELKSFVTQLILEKDIFSSYCYINVNIKDKGVTPIPTLATYSYYQVLENADNISIEYGGSVLNPYLVKSAYDYNTFVLQTDDTNKNTIADKNFILNKYLRFVSNITFNSSNSLVAETYNVIFKGVLDGNGMTIENLRINADTSKSNNAINKQLSSEYLENETYVAGKDEKSDDIVKKATSLGLFGKLINGAVVKNLDVNVSELYGTGVNFVGTIAGQVKDSKIYNINVSGTNVVYGRNIVGGIAGSVTGKSSLVNLNSEVPVTATYYGTYNGIDATNIDLDTEYTLFNSYSPGYYERDDDGNIKLDENGKKIYNSSLFATVSHAGGIAGAVSIEKDDVTDNLLDTNAIGQIRHVVAAGNSNIIGEVVGGLFGFVGANTLVTSSKVYVTNSSLLNASRVSGGIAGINLGAISRSFVSNESTVQTAIEKALGGTFSSADQLYAEALSSGTGSDTFFGGNPHFMGGIVGLNLGGIIGDTYNKVNVSNINSQYAGGIIGANVSGQLKSVYTTADVYAFLGIGGVVGLNISDLDIGSTAIHLENIEDFIASGSKTLNMQGVVAINLWKFEHINHRRSHLGGLYTGTADIGSLVGKVIGTNSGIVVDSDLKRQLSENVYTITTYTYDSIYNYSIDSAKDGYNRFELLPEIGNMNEPFTLTSKSSEEVKNNYSDTNKNIIYNYNIQDTAGNTYDMYCGNVIEITDITESDGKTIFTIGDKIHYSRLRKYSSSRTLTEIINRVYSRDLEKTTLNKIYGGIANVTYCNNLKASIDEEIPSEENVSSKFYDMDYQKIYPSNIWTLVVWSGVGVNRVDSENSEYEKSDSHILPIHEKKSSDMVIDVHTYEDLLQANDYPSATFRLCADIYVESDKEPILSLGNPFTGILMSKDVDPRPYKIIFENGMTGAGSVGLFAAIKGAEIKDVDFEVNGTLKVSNNGNNNSAAGVIFGYGYSAGNNANILSNIDITFNAGAGITAHKDDFSAAYLGSVGGSVESVYLNDVTVNNPVISLGAEDSSVSTNNVRNRSVYLGGLFGYASISANMNVEFIEYTSKNIAINNPTIIANVEFEGGEYDTLAIGGGFGKLVNASNKAISKVNGVTITDPNIITKLSTSASQFVNFENIAIGGGFGIIEGSNPNTIFEILNVDVIKDSAATLNVENTGVYASSRFVNKGNLSVGGVIGQIGTNGNGFVSLEDFTNEMPSVSYVHTNAMKYIENTSLNSSVNISAVVGSVISCAGDISGLIGDTDLIWSLHEADRVEINVGNVVGFMNNTNASYLISYKYLQPVENKRIYLGEKTTLNIGGVVGKMTGGSLSKSGFNANVVLYLAENSTSNVNMGGLVGYAGSETLTTTISECITSGKVVLHSYSQDQDHSNIAGLIGYVNHSIYIVDSYTSSDIEVDLLASGNSNLSAYHTIAGMIGLLEVNDKLSLNVNISTSYTVANIIANKSENSDSYIAGIIGRAQTKDGNDIEASVLLDSAYYLANFMLDTNAMGTALSVEELLYRENGEYNTYFGIFNKSTVWAFVENEPVDAGDTDKKYRYPLLKWSADKDSKYSQLIDNKLCPVVIEDLTQDNLKDADNNPYAGVIFVNTTDSLIGTNLSISSCDIYIKAPLNSNQTIFNSVDKYSRIYGIVFNEKEDDGETFKALTAHVINENNGKIAGTAISNLNSVTGYIKTNKGIDINPVITVSGNSIYDSNIGNTIYAKFNFSGSGNVCATTSTGELELSVITLASSASVTLNINTINSYIYDGNDTYTYYNRNGASLPLSSEQATNYLNFTDGYDFYNDFIILPYDEEIHSEDKNRHEGRVFLRWELKEGIGKKWYFEDISLFSTTQTAYSDYAWSNYVNNNFSSITEIDILVASNDIFINSELGLAYYSRLINSKDYANYINKNVYINSDIDLFGRLFTPIGSSYLLDNSSNVFSGALYGQNKTISNLYVIIDKNGGLFGTSAGTKFTNLNLYNSTIIVNSGAVGNLVANQVATALYQNIKVDKSIILHSMIGDDESIIGGILGRAINSDITINNCGLVGEIGNLNNAYIIGGLLGKIENGSLSIMKSSNNQDIHGRKYLGGLVGFAKDTYIELNQSYNEGEIKAVELDADTYMADSTYSSGGLIGYVDNRIADVKLTECYSSAGVSGYNAGGLIGLTNSKTNLYDVYVSRGDVDGTHVTRSNVNDNVIISNGGSNAAFVNVTDTSLAVSIQQGYSSLLDLELTNSTNLTTYKTYRISTKDDTEFSNGILTVTHATLSEPNNDIFENWSYTWSRVSQKNNNYPVLLFTNGSWLGEEPDNDGTTFYISKEAHLTWVAEQVNGGYDTFAGKKIVFTTSTLDFQKKLWSPIGHSEVKSFQGEVDFGNLEIRNMTTNGYYKNNIYTEGNLIKNYVGLFGYTKNAIFNGRLTFTRDSSTPNEGAHVKGLGDYVGAFIGYAKNTTITEGSVITNYLNVEGVGSYVGGIIGAYEIDGSIVKLARSGLNYSLGTLINHGSVTGLLDGRSENVAGVIGIIKANDVDVITLIASKMENHGDINHVVGNSGGVIAQVLGSNLTLIVTDSVKNTSNLDTSASNLGGIIGYSNGTVIFNNAVIENDKTTAVGLRSRNTESNIGSVIGYGNNVTINRVQLDADGINISSYNQISFAQDRWSSGAVGGLVGLANNLTLQVTEDYSVDNITFICYNESNYIGGIVGRVNDTFNLLGNEPVGYTTLSINNISGIQGVGFMGGIAGYIENFYTNNTVCIELDNINITDITDVLSSNYSAEKTSTFGYIGGAYGYIKYSVGDVMRLHNYKLTNSTITNKTNYLGGLVGRLGVTIDYDLNNIEINNCEILGNIDTKSTYVGGVIGASGNGADSSSYSNLYNVKIIDSNIYGYTNVGGVVGQIYKSNIAGIYIRGVNIGSIFGNNAISNSENIGGVVGYAENVNIQAGTFAGYLKGSNHIGSVVGLGKNVDISNIESSIIGLYVTSTATEGIRYAGGIIGRGENAEIANVDVESVLPTGTTIKFGGVAGYLEDCFIYEASTNIATEGTSNIYGIVNTLRDCKEGVNWFSNNYWFFDVTYNVEKEEKIFTNELHKTFSMAYAKDVKDAKIIKDHIYGETVIYSKPVEEGKSIEIKMANGNIGINTNFVNMTEEERMSAVYQIYMEAGLWNVVVNEDGSKGIIFTTDIALRSVLGYVSGKDYILEDKEGRNAYINMYAAMTKRYLPDMKAKDVVIKVLTDIDDVNTTGFDYYEKYIMPLGTAFFPINNLTIMSEWEEDEEKVIRTLYLDSIGFIPGSSSYTNYNLYGLFGFVEGNVTVVNVNISGVSETLYSDIDLLNANGINKVHGTLLASAVPTVYSPKTTIIETEKLHTFLNVTTDVDINESDAVVIGNLIGEGINPVSIEDNVVKSRLLDIGKTQVNLSEISYAINLINVVNKGDVIVSSPNDMLIVGGVIAKIENLNPSGTTNYVINVDGVDIDEEIAILDNITGVRNEGNICCYTANNAGIYGGVIGSISDYVTLNVSSELNAMMQNVGSIGDEESVQTGDIVGGVIGKIDLNEHGYEFEGVRNDLGSNVYANMYNGEFVYVDGIYYTLTNLPEDYTEEVESIKPNAELMGNTVGGVIGYIAGNQNIDSPSKVKLLNLHNYMSISGLLVNSDDVYAAGILGGYNEYLQGIEFNTCMNRGKILSHGKSIGGMLSEIRREFDSDNIELYPYLKGVKFVNCLNSVEANIGDDSNTYAGGLVGYISDISDGNYSGEDVERIKLELEINNSRSEGTINSKTADYGYAGGLVGYLDIGKGSRFILSSTEKATWIESDEYEVKDVSPSTIEGEYAGGLIGYITADADTLMGHINNSSSYYGIDRVNVKESFMDYLLDQIYNSAYKDNVTNYIYGHYTNGMNTLKGHKAVGGVVGYYEQNNETSKSYLLLTSLDSTTNIIANDQLEFGVGGMISQIKNVDNFVVYDCNLYGNITADDNEISPNYVGGVIGEITSGNDINKLEYLEINKVTTQNIILNAAYDVGGFVGKLQGDSITAMFVDCINSSNIELVHNNTSIYPSAGGFIGYAFINSLYIGIDKEGTMNRTSGNITNEKYGGGGFVGHDMSTSTTIVNAVSNVSIKAKDAGGFIGLAGEDTLLIYSNTNDVADGAIFGYFGNSLTSSEYTSTVGGLVGSAYINVIDIENITVGNPYNYSLKTFAGEYVGGVVGYVYAEEIIDIENCSVNNINLNSSISAGGLVGFTNDASVIFIDNAVNNIQFSTSVVEGNLDYNLWRMYGKGVYGVNHQEVYTQVYRCATDDTDNHEGAELIQEYNYTKYVRDITPLSYNNLDYVKYNFAIGNQIGVDGVTVTLRSTNKNITNGKDIITSRAILLNELDSFYNENLWPLLDPEDFESGVEWRESSAPTYTEKIVYIGKSEIEPDIIVEDLSDVIGLEISNYDGALVEFNALKIENGCAVIDTSRLATIKGLYDPK